MKYILASQSPRRKEILENLGLNIQVRPSDADENIKIQDPVEFAKELALLKARSTEKKMDELIIAADTIVVFNGKILGKPTDEKQAREFLGILSGNTHEVITAVSICYKEIEDVSYAVTHVKFDNISPEEIDAYIHSNEWTDKAGGYGIQGNASLFIERIDGCYFNVVGFPVNMFYKMCAKNNINIIGDFKWELKV